MPTNILKGALLFGLLGPAIGLLMVVVPIMAMTSAWSLNAFLLLIPAAYFTGGIPAVITGAILGTTRSKLHGLWAYLLAAVVGALCSASYYLIVAARGGPDLRQMGLLFVLPGLAAGLVCGYIFLKPPNNSFKPKPLRGSA